MFLLLTASIVPFQLFSFIGLRLLQVIFTVRCCVCGSLRKHLSPYNGCTWQWIWVASNLFSHKKTI